MARKSKKNDLLWAEEVMEVYQNLGSLPGSRNWSSPSAKHLFDWAREVENETKFLTTMTPKALDLLNKLRPDDVSEAVLEIDTKTIQELKRHLAVAVESSQTEPKPAYNLDDIL